MGSHRAREAVTPLPGGARGLLSNQYPSSFPATSSCCPAPEGRMGDLQGSHPRAHLGPVVKMHQLPAASLLTGLEGVGLPTWAWGGASLVCGPSSPHLSVTRITTSKYIKGRWIQLRL